MPNESGNAYGLTTLCPLRTDVHEDQSCATIVRERLRNLPQGEASPFARVPNLYMCRFFVLDDVFFQGHPAAEDHLKSKYLVFVAELHIAGKGQLEAFLEVLWTQAQETVWDIWQHCIGFDEVTSALEFSQYIKKCQVETTFYFNGSNDRAPAEQLKALYLKQELAKFARQHQGKDALTLQRAFQELIERIQPFQLSHPTWRPGGQSLASVVITDS
jgi:hypothetical protein